MLLLRSTPWAIVVVHALMLGPVLADGNDHGQSPVPVDPAGSWQWDYTFNDNTAEFSLKLEWEGERLTGKYTAFNNTSDIEETKLADDALSFIARREFNGNPFIVRFNGKVEPDDITGTVEVNFGDEPREFDWHAKRVVEVDDVLGTWELRLEMPDGRSIEPRLTITQDGEKLQGTYVSPFGERAAKNVQLKENQLSWEISGERDGFEFKIVYTGRPRGNTITGANEFDFGGNTGSMEFTGKRTPPEPVEPAAEPTASQPADENAGTAEPADTTTSDAEPAATAESTGP